MTVARDLQTNPLINPPNLRHGALPLDVIQTAHFKPAFEYGIARMQAELDRIRNNPEPPTFANTSEALEFAGAELAYIDKVFQIFTATKTSGALKKLDGAIRATLSKVYNDLFLDEALFAKIKVVYDDPRSAALGPEEKTLLKKQYNAFVRAGALLDPKSKKRVRAIDARLSRLSVKYSNNARDSKEAYKKIVDLVDLDGVPDRVLKILTAAAEKEKLSGKAVVRLDSQMDAILDYATNRALREELQSAYRTIAYTDPKYDNRPLILEIVTLRHERAKLFGYRNHAESVLSDRMAKNPETVTAFLERNLAAYKPAAEAHLQKLRDYAYEVDGLTDLKPWDIGYYQRRLAEKTFQVDMEAARPYFAMDNVIQGFYNHVEKAFGLEFREESYPVHTKDLKVYEVFNKASNSVIALFYANYYENTKLKNGGAWMDSIRDRAVRNGVVSLPIATNDCNYQKPSPDGPPTLLEMYDDVVVRHEGGHALHAMMATGKYPSLNGVNVKWDWVEVPSQLQENWARQKSVLQEYARHYKDGTPIPEDMLDKIVEAERFGSGMAGLRQTFLGMLDMKWHTTDPATIESVDALEDSVGAIALLLPRVRGLTSTNFSHIFSGGYDSGYYSYKWAELIEADVFGAFQENGLYHQPTLDGVRKFIYEPGGTREPDELFRDLMKRDPDPAAMFRREGITVPKPA